LFLARASALNYGGGGGVGLERETKGLEVERWEGGRMTYIERHPEKPQLHVLVGS